MPISRLQALLLGAVYCLAQPGTAGELSFANTNLVNVSGKTFFSALRDKTSQERAQLYMAGVLDTTEGKSWCGFGLFKSDTLQEIVYRHFVKLPPERLNERAARLIEEALASRHPCKSKP